MNCHGNARKWILQSPEQTSTLQRRQAKNRKLYSETDTQGSTYGDIPGTGQIAVHTHVSSTCVQESEGGCGKLPPYPSTSGHKTGRSRCKSSKIRRTTPPTVRRSRVLARQVLFFFKNWTFVYFPPAELWSSFWKLYRTLVLFLPSELPRLRRLTFF